jgi:hypothetical protein
MYPQMNERLASEHTRELHAQAQRSRLSAQAQHGRQCPACAQAAQNSPYRMRQAQRNTVRHRAGWTLVEIGLRLAGSAPEG